MLDALLLPVHGIFAAGECLWRIALILVGFCLGQATYARLYVQQKKRARRSNKDGG